LAPLVYVMLFVVYVMFNNMRLAGKAWGSVTKKGRGAIVG
jgi:hypothetical protein